MWFSIIVPILVGAEWIWPQLRVPKVWFRLSWLALSGTVLWLGVDLYHYVEERGLSQSVGLRVIFLFLRETGIPALQLTLGFFIAGLFSSRFKKPNIVDSDSSIS